MLAALLIAGLVSAPLCTAATFIPLPWRGRAAGSWPAVRRLLLALVATVALLAVVYVTLRALGVTPHNTYASLAALTVSSLVWLPVSRRWSARAHLAWASTILLFVAYLAFMLWWTFASHLGPAGTVGGVLLWLLEAAAAVLGAAYMWEMCDAVGSEVWFRRIREGVVSQSPDHELPFVSLHVPAHNEPPEMVIETVRTLQGLDYPNYEVVVIDDNTAEPELWEPVRAWCEQHGVRFAHLADWPGFKSGALNYALQHLTDPRAQLIGVVDSDYLMRPDFLRRCAPLFADPNVGFIQAPQDYRDWERDPYLRRLYYSYSYFFAVSQPSRNERDGAIFAGTMGLIRRTALEEVGGWDEWCITEDAELSFRLLRAGWSGLHVDRSFGRGVMPLTFEALKSQRFRWCFGGIQILRRYWREMLPGPRTPGNRLNLRQRWSYLSGAVQWYGDLLALLFLVFLLIGAANLGVGGDLVFRKLTGFLLGAIPVLVVLGLVRAVALIRRGTGATLREALGAFMIWQSTGLVVARASVQALFAREAEFLRTPKTAEEESLSAAVKGNWIEIILGVFGLAAIATSVARSFAHPAIGGLLAALLVWPTSSMLAAPANSLAAQRASLSPELRQRRRTEWLRDRRSAVRHATAAAGITAALAGALAVGALVSAPSPGPVSSPPLLGPARGGPGPGAISYPPRHSGTGKHGAGPAPIPDASPSGASPPSSAPTAPPPASPSTAPSIATTPASPQPSYSASPSGTSTPSPQVSNPAAPRAAYPSASPAAVAPTG